eukprot:767262-Hanusia_phi.AAC.1
MDKDNVVAQNAVFVESMLKERKAFRLREEFMLVPKYEHATSQAVSCSRRRNASGDSEEGEMKETDCASDREKVEVEVCGDDDWRGGRDYEAVEGKEERRRTNMTTLGLEIKHPDPSVVAQLNSTLKEQHKTPKQKYEEPMTTQQEIGCEEEEEEEEEENVGKRVAILTNMADRKQYGLKGNPITKYAEKYVVDMGRNP